MDQIDIANDIAAEAIARSERKARQAAAGIPEGSRGDCDLCGEWSARLVHGACAGCRDHYRLP